MPGKDNAKQKTIAIYDYFRKHVGDKDEDTVMIEDVRRYLCDLFGDNFERKSIYSDIKSINAYVSKMTSGNNEEWITMCPKNHYRRNLSKDELTYDEVRTIADAINASAFAKSGLADKIQKEWPVFFEDKRYVPLYSKNKTAIVSNKNENTYRINIIRDAIAQKQQVRITYGYHLADNIVNKHDSIISPCMLYWENDMYYLVAVKSNEDNTVKSIRRYRLDRIASVSFLNSSDSPDPEYVVVNEPELSEYMASSVNNYAGSNKESVKISLTGDKNAVLKAYNRIADVITPRAIISDKWENGEIVFFLDVAVSPAFYSLLFELSTFSAIDEDNNEKFIHIAIDNEKIAQGFKNFVARASTNITYSAK